jgi:hypothetical protein
MTSMASAEIDEAREAHAYWSQRASTLAWYRPAARREARELAARWRVRLVTAQLESWRLGALTGLVVPLFATRRRRRPRPQLARTALALALVVGFVVHLAT